MSEWTDTTLADICLDISYGYTASATEEAIGPKFLRITDIASGRLEWGTVPFCPINESDLEKYKLYPGDIVIARTGATTGANYTLKEKDPVNVVFASYLIRYKINPQIAFPYYIGHILRSSYWFDYVDAIAGGSAQPGANAKQLGSFEIKLPPLPEQRAIAFILSSLDDKIDLLQKQNQTLEKMAETLFRQWFVEEAKEDWENTTLDKHIEAIRGLSYKGSGLAEKGIGLPMHNLNSVNEGGGYKYEGIKYYTGEYKERHLIQPGNIIVTNTEQGHEFRLIGFPAIVPETFGSKGLFSQHIYKIVLRNKSYLSNEFIYYLLMVPSMREQITAATNGSTVNMLAIDGLERPEFQLPPKELVDDFSLIVSNYWKKKTINQNQIRTLTALRDTLLPKLMSGVVTVEIN